MSSPKKKKGTPPSTHFSPSDLRWKRVAEIAGQALQLSPPERRRYLQSLESTEGELLSEVESLIRAHDSASGFLESPAGPKIASLIHQGLEPTKTMPALGEIRAGKYLLLKRLSAGGMAEVYLGKALGASDFTKYVAIKRILPEYSSHPEFRQHLEVEAKLCGQLNHPNIVQIHDFTLHEGGYLLVMEYIRGKNASELLRRIAEKGRTLPLELAAYIVEQVCGGLAYAHGKNDDSSRLPLNIVHRDISPHNVMLSYDGAVKIVDFGIAKAILQRDKTQTGIVKGKLAYLSPEQRAGLGVDQRTDIYAAGILLFELVTGEKPGTEGSDYPELVAGHSRIPKPLRPLLRKALAPDPFERYQTAHEFRLGLQQYLSQFPAFHPGHLGNLLGELFHEEIGQEEAWIAMASKFSDLPGKSAFRRKAMGLLAGTIALIVVIWTLAHRAPVPHREANGTHDSLDPVLSDPLPFRMGMGWGSPSSTSPSCVAWNLAVSLGSNNRFGKQVIRNWMEPDDNINRVSDSKIEIQAKTGVASGDTRDSFRVALAELGPVTVTGTVSSCREGSADPKFSYDLTGKKAIQVDLSQIMRKSGSHTTVPLGGGLGLIFNVRNAREE